MEILKNLVSMPHLDIQYIEKGEGATLTSSIPLTPYYVFFYERNYAVQDIKLIVIPCASISECEKIKGYIDTMRNVTQRSTPKAVDSMEFYSMLYPPIGTYEVRIAYRYLAHGIEPAKTTT